MTEKNKLGKGLSSLLGEKKNFSVIAGKSANNAVNNDDITENSALKDISLELIDRNPEQPRKRFHEDTILELAESIKENGLLQPIIVRQKKIGRYEIVAGERRFLATKKLGLKTIQVIVRKNGEEKLDFIASLIENIQRADLNAIEEANAYRILVEKYQYTQEELSKSVGKSRTTITNTLRLLNLPEIIQEHLISGDIEMGHARALVNCNFALDIIDYIVKNKLTVREVEKLVKQERDYIKPGNKKAEKVIIDNLEEFRKKNSEFCKLSYSEKTKFYTLNIKFKDYKLLEEFINKNK